MPADWLSPERIASVTFAVSLLLAALFAGAKGWWYFRASYDNMVTQYKERLIEKDALIEDERGRSKKWEEIALKALNVGEKAVSKAEKNGN